MKYHMSALFVLLILSACATKSMESSVTEDSDKTSVSKNLAALPKNDVYSDGKSKLIKEARYRFEVKNVKESTTAIETAMRKYPAYISSSNLTLENPILENKMTIRVESQYFNDLLQDIDKEALFVNTREVTTEDVSKEFVDLESRLATKREVESRYMNILRNKAGTVEELLEAERQIGALHEEIEATISRMNYLKDQVRYSSINLEFYQTITERIAQTREPMSDKFVTALTAGLNGLLNVMIGIVFIWPLLLVGGIVLTYLSFRKKMKIKI